MAVAVSRERSGSVGGSARVGVGESAGEFAREPVAP